MFDNSEDTRQQRIVGVVHAAASMTPPPHTNALSPKNKRLVKQTSGFVTKLVASAVKHGLTVIHESGNTSRSDVSKYSKTSVIAKTRNIEGRQLEHVI